MHPIERRRVRRKLMKRQQRKCCYCSQWMRDYGPATDNRATIEHVRPLSLGGTDEIGNLKLACWTCNNQRGNLLAEHLNHFRRKAEEELQQL